MQRQHILSSILAIVTCSVLLLAGSSHAHAQQGKKIATQEVDTIPWLNGMAVSIDAFGAAQLALSDYGQIEASLRVNLKDKYYPIIELGYGKADKTDESTNLHYKTSAPYGRIGVDWNLLKNKHDIYRLYGGFRYALTYYKYDLEGPDMKDPVWGGSSPYRAEGVSCNYHWLEGVFGVDAKIWGPIRMGWSVRYKRRLFHNDGDLGNAWHIPGFGIQGSSRFGGTFNVTFEL